MVGEQVRIEIYSVWINYFEDLAHCASRHEMGFVTRC